jgi:hypothetical protein
MFLKFTCKYGDAFLENTTTKYFFALFSLIALT